MAGPLDAPLRPQPPPLDPDAWISPSETRGSDPYSRSTLMSGSDPLTPSRHSNLLSEAARRRSPRRASHELGSAHGVDPGFAQNSPLHSQVLLGRRQHSQTPSPQSQRRELRSPPASPSRPAQDRNLGNSASQAPRSSPYADPESPRSPMHSEALLTGRQHSSSPRPPYRITLSPAAGSPDARLEFPEALSSGLSPRHHQASPLAGSWDTRSEFPGALSSGLSPRHSQGAREASPLAGSRDTRSEFPGALSSGLSPRHSQGAREASPLAGVRNTRSEFPDALSSGLSPRHCQGAREEFLDSARLSSSPSRARPSLPGRAPGREVPASPSMHSEVLLSARQHGSPILGTRSCRALGPEDRVIASDDELSPSKHSQVLLNLKQHSSSPRRSPPVALD
ncbi:unnamed protein product, partial [Polarella glacialis]